MSSEKDIIPSIIPSIFSNLFPGCISDTSIYGIDYDLLVGGKFFEEKHKEEEMKHEKEVEHEEEVEHKKEVTFDEVLRSSSNPEESPSSDPKELPSLGYALLHTLESVDRVHKIQRLPGRFRPCCHTGRNQTLLGISTKTHRYSQDEKEGNKVLWWNRDDKRMAELACCKEAKDLQRSRGDKRTADEEILEEFHENCASKRACRMGIRQANSEWKVYYDV